MGGRVDQARLRVLPQQRIADDDRGGEAGRPPEGREVDHRRRKPGREEHVPGQIAVDELGGAFVHRAQRVGQLRQVLDVCEVLRWKLAPGDPVADSPGTRPSIEERGTRLAGERSVHELPHRDHVPPGALRGAHLRGAPSQPSRR